MASLAIAAMWGWRRFSPPGKWAARPYSDLKILVVDYTVPFENFREHAGLFWLLNHRKVRAPVAAPKAGEKESGEPWQLARDYVGYRPSDREHPVRLSHVDRKHTEMIYVTDTYGVYRDDLKHLDTQTAHMDYSPLVFGGLSNGDAYALSQFVHRGGFLVTEFNTFCEPTPPAERHMMEDLFGLDWTEWVGRVLADPYDQMDVPHWLAREFAKQYPTRELPHSPILLLAARDGRLLIFGGLSLGDVAPRVVMTAAGRKRFPHAPGDAPYYFWFSIMRARPGTRVHALLELPKITGIPDLLARITGGETPPALTEIDGPTGHTIYFAGDFADIDFEPGAYTSEGIIASRTNSVSVDGMTTAPAYWRFYAPIVDQLLSEAIVAHVKPKSTPKPGRVATGER